jgi:cysteine desulfuration protein SufE
MSDSKIPPNIQSILEDIEMVGDEGRAMVLLDYSDHFQAVPPQIAERPFSENNHVRECESDAYVFPERRSDGRLNFHFAVENPQGVSARAFSRILQEAVDGQSAAEINAISPEIVPLLFGRGISMGKGMGLQGILTMVKYFATQNEKGQ